MYHETDGRFKCTTTAPWYGRAVFARWTDEEVAAALLAAYEEVSLFLSSRLYLPMGEVRAALRRRLAARPRPPTRRQLDDMLRGATGLLPGHYVALSPFSGPVPRSAGGLLWTDPLGQPAEAGFLSVRPREALSARRPRAGAPPPAARRRAGR